MMKAVFRVFLKKQTMIALPGLSSGLKILMTSLNAAM